MEDDIEDHYERESIMKASNSIRQVQKELFEMQDVEYRDFHSKLIPNVDATQIIGVRTPRLRSYAKQFAHRAEAADFLRQLPHTYYEENNLHAFLIEQIKDYETCVKEWNRFLPYVDNWATCDMPMPKVFKKHLPELLPQIRSWMDSGETYTVRFGIGMLMRLYLEDDTFSPEYPAWVADVHSEEYYIHMMVAWYFATALAKQWEAVIPYLEERRLTPWCHNKAIQKSVESRRITPEHKDYLRALRWKDGA